MARLNKFRRTIKYSSSRIKVASQYSKVSSEGVLKRRIEFSTSVILKDGITEGPPVGVMDGSVHGPIETSSKRATSPEFGGDL